MVPMSISLSARSRHINTKLIIPRKICCHSSLELRINMSTSATNSIEKLLQRESVKHEKLKCIKSGLEAANKDKNNSFRRSGVPRKL